MAAIQVSPGMYNHEANQLANHLGQHLPEAVALRTILQSPLRSPIANIVATFSPDDSPPRYFLVAYVDLSRPGTQVWFYSSCQKAPKSLNLALEVKTQLQALLQYLSLLDYSNCPGGRAPMMGCVPDIFVDILNPMSTVTYSSIWMKYLFCPRTDGSLAQDAIKLDPGLAFGKVEENDIHRVMETTAIPRSKAELIVLPNVAIHDSNGPEKSMVAWCYLAIDGSLSTLYVEEEYRGRGLAKAVGTEILRQQQGWSHSDVAETNLNSRGVLKSLGGVLADWKIGWIRVDLDKLSV